MRAVRRGDVGEAVRARVRAKAWERLPGPEREWELVPGKGPQEALARQELEPKLWEAQE